MEKKYKKEKDYIIVRETDEGHFKPITFKDGTLVIYGSRNDAEPDMGKGDVLAEIKIVPSN